MEIISNMFSPEAFSAFFQVIMIDLVLAGDNAIVIGLAAAGLPKEMRSRAILIGIGAATVMGRSAFGPSPAAGARAAFWASTSSTVGELVFFVTMGVLLGTGNRRGAMPRPGWLSRW